MKKLDDTTGQEAWRARMKREEKIALAIVVGGFAALLLMVVYVMFVAIRAVYF